MNRIFRFLSLALLASVAIWSAGLFLDGRGGRFASVQPELFYRRGSEALNDYYMPWKCAHEGYRQETETVGYVAPDGRRLAMDRLDRCYPPFALLPYLALPCTDAAAAAFTAVCAALFLLALFRLARREGVPRPAFAVAVLALTAPFLFTLERANPVFLSAAGVACFLADFDSEREDRRTFAAFALAFAAVLKLSPALLGVLFLRRRDWKSAGIAAGVSAALFLLPFVCFADGSFAEWLSHAAEHGREMSGSAAWGFAPFHRAVAIIRGVDWRAGVAPACLAARLLGFALLAGAVFTRRRDDAALLAVTGLLLAPGNMLFYAALYLYPVCLMRAPAWNGRRGRLEALAWFALFASVQIPFGPLAANRLLAASAVLALPAFCVRRCR